MHQKLVHRFTLITAASTLILIAAGGLVTSTGSGLSVPDWPLSYGQFFPPMIGGIRFEHSHRVIAAIVGIMTFAMTLIYFSAEKRGWVKALALLAFFMVIGQAALGALTVIYLLPDPISVSHACLGQTFFMVLCALTLFTSREWCEGPVVYAKRSGNVQRLFLITFCFVYLQLVLGAMVRHIPGHASLSYHFAVAFLILIHAIFIVPKTAKEKPVQKLFLKQAMLLAMLVSAQLFLGLGSYIYKIVMEPGPMPRTAEILFTTAHQTNGALILATTAVLTLRSYRLLKKNI